MNDRPRKPAAFALPANASAMEPQSDVFSFMLSSR